MEEDRQDIKTGRNNKCGRSLHGFHRLKSIDRSPSCSYGRVSYVQGARGVWLSYTRRRSESGVMVEEVVSCWLLEGCVCMIVNENERINVLCKIQSGTNMKQRQTQETWKKVFVLIISLHIFCIFLLFAVSAACQCIFCGLLHKLVVQ